jgi:hypothetical protein
LGFAERATARTGPVRSLVRAVAISFNDRDSMVKMGLYNPKIKMF